MLQNLSKLPVRTCKSILVWLGRGYNTAAEREAARDLPGVSVLSLEQSCRLLRYGVASTVRPAHREP